MANSINTSTNLWTFDTGDIVSTVPICVRKVRMKATAAGDEALFYSLPGGKNATSDTSARYTIDVTNTATITEVGTSSWLAAAYNDWVLIENCSTTANDGWYLVSATSSAHAFVIENGTNALTNSTAQTATISIYTPIKSMALFSDTVQATQASISHATLDWGSKGRWFDNLSFWETTGMDLSIDLYVR